MSLKNSMKKTNNFLHKSLQTIRSILFGSYQNQPNTHILNTKNLDQISSSNQWEKPKNLENLPAPNAMKTTAENLTSSEPQSKPELALCGETREEANGSRSFRLVQKMKVLEMMNEGEVDHALDVEEALHYYSRLTCPIYVDIVDKFFMDMYRDYYFPQLSISLASVSRRLSSSRRLGSSKRFGSSRRLGPVLL